MRKSKKRTTAHGTDVTDENTESVVSTRLRRTFRSDDEPVSMSTVCLRDNKERTAAKRNAKSAVNLKTIDDEKEEEIVQSKFQRFINFFKNIGPHHDSETETTEVQEIKLTPEKDNAPKLRNKTSRRRDRTGHAQSNKDSETNGTSIVRSCKKSSSHKKECFESDDVIMDYSFGKRISRSHTHVRSIASPGAVIHEDYADLFSRGLMPSVFSTSLEKPVHETVNKWLDPLPIKSGSKRESSLNSDDSSSIRYMHEESERPDNKPVGRIDKLRRVFRRNANIDKQLNSRSYEATPFDQVEELDNNFNTNGDGHPEEMPNGRVGSGKSFKRTRPNRPRQSTWLADEMLNESEAHVSNATKPVEKSSILQRIKNLRKKDNDTVSGNRLDARSREYFDARCSDDETGCVIVEETSPRKRRPTERHSIDLFNGDDVNIDTANHKENNRRHKKTKATPVTVLHTSVGFDSEDEGSILSDNFWDPADSDYTISDDDNNGDSVIPVNKLQNILADPELGPKTCVIDTRSYQDYIDGHFIDAKHISDFETEQNDLYEEAFDLCNIIILYDDDGHTLTDSDSDLVTCHQFVEAIGKRGYVLENGYKCIHEHVKHLTTCSLSRRRRRFPILSVFDKPGLYLCSADTENIRLLLQHYHIDRVICLDKELKLYLTNVGVDARFVRFNEKTVSKSARTYESIVKLACSKNENHRSILLCSKNADTSACVALIACIMFKCRWTLGCAYKYVRNRRSTAELHRPYMSSLQNFEKKLYGKIITKSLSE